MATTAFFRSVQSTWLEVQHTLEETRGWAGRSDIFVLSSDAGAANTQTHIHTHAHVGRWGWRRSPGMSEEMGRGGGLRKKEEGRGGEGTNVPPSSRDNHYMYYKNSLCFSPECGRYPDRWRDTAIFKELRKNGKVSPRRGLVHHTALVFEKQTPVPLHVTPARSGPEPTTFGQTTAL